MWDTCKYKDARKPDANHEKDLAASLNFSFCQQKMFYSKTLGCPREVWDFSRSTLPT